MSVAELTTKVAEAKKAYKANKADKSLKKAYKALQAELAAAEEAAKKAAEEAAKKKRKAPESSDDDSDSDSDSSDSEPAAKKAKVVDVAALKQAAADAKKAYKANKADKSLKAKYKEAKAAAEKAEAEQAGAGAAAAEAPKEEKNEEVDMLSNLKKNKPAAAVTSESGKAATEKLFCGNLSWDIDDDGIKEFFKEFGELTDVHWLTDRDSGKFKGCGFVTFTSVENASNALQSKNGVELLGRPIKLDFATPRPGGNAGGAKKKFGQDRPMSEKPEGCTTVFAGNLSFQIDDDQMHEFAKDSGDIKSIRWLTDRDSGDFKGCGFIEFYKTEAVDEFVKLNGKDLLGRAIRLDYAKARAPKPEW